MGNSMKRLSRGRVVHAAGSGNGKGKILSNFAPASFAIDGARYASFESF